MPRYTEPESATPFGKVLVDYMWSRRPPVGAVQLAVRLGIPKQSVTNWVMRGSSPSLETMLYVLAKLDIPLRVLYDAYKNAGLSVPRFDLSSADAPIITPEGITGQRKETRVPVAAEPDESAYTSRTSPASSPASSHTGVAAPEPRPYTPPFPRDPDQESAAEWDALIKQTSAALRAEGMSQASIDAVVASLRARQAGQTTAERQIQAEHREDQEDREDQQTQEAEPSEPSEPQTRETKRRGQPTAK